MAIDRNRPSFFQASPRFGRVAAAGLLATLAMSAPAYAQQDDALHHLDLLREISDGFEELQDCIFVEDSQRNSGLKIFRKRWEGDKKRRKVLEMQIDALLQYGYNYALMSPMVVYDEANYSTYVKYGWGQARKVTEKTSDYLKAQAMCESLDDTAAFDMMWDERSTDVINSVGQRSTLVDLRAMVDALGLNIRYKPMQRKTDGREFEYPGMREIVDMQYAVKRDAARCRTALRPASLREYHADGLVRDRAAERQCLEKLRDRAVEADWSAFPLFVEDVAATPAPSGGYSLNRNLDGTAVDSPPLRTRYKLFPTDHQDKATYDVGARFPGFDGVVKYNLYTEDIVVASNTLERDQLVDYAVFTAARNVMRGSRASRPKPNVEVEVSNYHGSASHSSAREARESGKYPRMELNNSTPFMEHAIQAYETYKNVLVVDYRTVTGRTCSTDKLVCADKVDAYNALGEKLNYRGFVKVAPTPDE